jgi:hypothetical protein
LPIPLEIFEVSGMTEHEYNAHGELETSLDQRGVLTIRTLDALDRVTQATWSNSVENDGEYF